MTQAAGDGMNWAPTSDLPQAVVQPGEFVFASAFFDHGHIFGQTNGLREAGGTLKWAWDPEPVRLKDFCEKYPEAQPAESYQQILDDPEVQLVTAAAVPCDRGPLGIEAMNHGKDYLTDKCPFTTLAQLAEARAAVERTGKKFLVDYSEFTHVECAWYAWELIQQGALGEIVHMAISGPHRLNKPKRPEWFFQKAQYGGILTDIASHQFYQFLMYADADEGSVNFARVDNFANADQPELEDFGEASLALDGKEGRPGASAYSRVDWFTPDGQRGWGDGRTFIVGTKGVLEIRKYFDVGRGDSSRIFLTDGTSEQEIDVNGKVGYPFYGRLILDCLNRTENAMTQHRAFKAAELSMLAQQIAEGGRSSG
ncbi:MAG: Gfo/Idh/MocA family protein [Opitutales bacterium]